MSIREYMDELISEVRPHAYKLTNSFIVNDILLHSKLGVTNGKIYEELYNTAANSKLNNKTSLEGIALHVKPLSKKLKVAAKI
mmetsp:Transcript_2209/g.2860  ORF Transcript_2209/g.2860 Transcript_2209/m.2860 type:complete len:83 (+) Transcript_2209:1675-1923(+)